MVFATLALFQTKIFDSPFPVSDQTLATRAHSHCYIILEVTETCSYFWFVSFARSQVKIASSKTPNGTHYTECSLKFIREGVNETVSFASLAHIFILSPISVQFSSP